jgi:hypothetical protein
VKEFSSTKMTQEKFIEKQMVSLKAKYYPASEAHAMHA